MQVCCGKCGAELLGAVNRCWRCGTAVLSRPGDTRIPPVRRPPLPGAAGSGVAVSPADGPAPGGPVMLAPADAPGTGAVAAPVVARRVGSPFTATTERSSAVSSPPSPPPETMFPVTPANYARRQRPPAWRWPPWRWGCSA